jgi:hypothetical protein
MRGMMGLAFALGIGMSQARIQPVAKPDPPFRFISNFKAELVENPWPPEKPPAQDRFRPLVKSYYRFKGKVDVIRSDMDQEARAFGYVELKSCFGGWAVYARRFELGQSGKTGNGPFEFAALWWDPLPEANSPYTCWLLYERDPTEAEHAWFGIAKRIQSAMRGR